MVDQSIYSPEAEPDVVPTPAVVSTALVHDTDTGENLLYQEYDDGSLVFSNSTGPVPEPANWAFGPSEPPTPEPLVYVTEVTAYCDNDLDETVYKQEYSDGTSVWFDSAGQIPEPSSRSIGVCAIADPDVEVTENVICYLNSTHIRRLTVNYVGGEPDTKRTEYFNGNGVAYDSGVVPYNDPFTGEPSGWSLGVCLPEFARYSEEKLCQKPGVYAVIRRANATVMQYYEVNTGQVYTGPTWLGPRSLATDYGGEILYQLRNSNNLEVWNMTNQVSLPDVALFTNDGSVVNVNTLTFNPDDGYLYGIGQTSYNLYRINPTTGEVSFHSGPYTGITDDADGLVYHNGEFYVASRDGWIYTLDVGALTVDASFNTGFSPLQAIDVDPSGNMYVVRARDLYAVDFAGQTTELLFTYDVDTGTGMALLNQPLERCFTRVFGVTDQGDQFYLYDYDPVRQIKFTAYGDYGCCDETTIAEPVEIAGPVEIDHEYQYRGSLPIERTGGVGGTTLTQTDLFNIAVSAGTAVALPDGTTRPLAAEDYMSQAVFTLDAEFGDTATVTVNGETTTLNNLRPQLVIGEHSAGEHITPIAFDSITIPDGVTVGIAMTFASAPGAE